VAPLNSTEHAESVSRIVTEWPDTDLSLHRWAKFIPLNMSIFVSFYFLFILFWIEQQILSKPATEEAGIYKKRQWSKFQLVLLDSFEKKEYKRQQKKKSRVMSFSFPKLLSSQTEGSKRKIEREMTIRNRWLGSEDMTIQSTLVNHTKPKSHYQTWASRLVKKN
jgi:hypothetical protein